MQTIALINTDLNSQASGCLKFLQTPGVKEIAMCHGFQPVKKLVSTIQQLEVFGSEINESHHFEYFLPWGGLACGGSVPCRPKI